jgi:hypothetical protein
MNMSANSRFALVVAVLIGAGITAYADDSDRLLTIDHYVRVVSTVPAIAGQPAQLYVRERVLAGGALRASTFADRVGLERRRKWRSTFPTRTTAGWHFSRAQDSTSSRST